VTFEPGASPRRRTTLVLLALCFIVVVGGGAFFWWWTAAIRERPLDPAWAARVVVIAGDGVTGTRSGNASSARFDDPFGVAVRADGTIFVSDGTDMPRVRAILPDGRVIDVAGAGVGFSDGPGASARFATISGLALATDGSIYVADTGNNAIHRIAPDGNVSTVAGDGTPGCVDGPGAQARFNGPMGVAVDSTGRLIVADTYNDRIRRIDRDGGVTTITGTSDPVAALDTPTGVAVGIEGRIYIADAGHAAIRILETSGELSTLEPVDGSLRPVGIATAEHNLFVTDERGRVVEIDANGSTRVVAGGAPGFADGPGADARFRRPAGIAVAAPGRLIVADSGNAVIRLVAAAATFEFRPPPPPGISPHFDTASFAVQPLLWPVAPMEGPHEIAGTMGEARGTDAERLHAGVDVRIDEGTPVLATRPGVVASPLSTGEFGSLNEWLRIGPVTYVHLRAGRELHDVPLDRERFVTRYDDSGKVVGMRLKRGARFATGEMIGSVNRFNHVHMNVGWPGEEFNPLDFRLLQFSDSIPPSIGRNGVMLIDQAGERLARKIRGRLIVSGPSQIIVDAWDQSDGNRPSRRLAPYALGYQVLKKDGSPVEGFEHPRETIRFNQLARDADVHLIYAAGSGIPFYGKRVTRFLFIVTNTFRDGVAKSGWWDAGALPPGDYIVRAFASDNSGNTVTRDLGVTIAR
jgi:sugar lactone lactonase YvrE